MLLWKEPYYFLEYEHYESKNWATLSTTEKHICLFAQMLLQPKYRTGVCCRTGQNKPTRTVTILISGKVPHSRVIFCCTLHPPDLYRGTRVSFGLGPARSRNNKYEWVFLGKNHTDDSRWCNGIYDLPACFRKPWPTSSVRISYA